MSIVFKIEELCRSKKTTITELEKKLGYGNGAIKRSSNQTLRSDRVQEIAQHFGVSPTYLISDVSADICPICGFLYDPLDEKQSEIHNKIHNNFLNLKNKIGMLFNPAQANTKRVFAKEILQNKDTSEDEKTHEYETLLHCDYADYAFSKFYDVEIEYSEFIKNEIIKKKYFDLISLPIMQKIAVRYNIHLDKDEKPFIEKIQDDEEYMANITNLFNLPDEFRVDVYKAIRHAKRDYADKEYFTSMYPTKTNPFT